MYVQNPIFFMSAVVHFDLICAFDTSSGHLLYALTCTASGLTSQQTISQFH